MSTKCAMSVSELTSCVAVAYTGKQQIPYHRDQVYHHLTGRFWDKKNSQERGTPTIILSIGDTRSLNFQLFRHNRKSDSKKGVQPVKKRGAFQQFELTHGSLLVIHHKDEETIIREAFGRYKTFFKHGSSGLVIVHENGMSLGLVLRSVTHFGLVDSSSGNLLFTEEDALLNSDQYRLHDSILRYFMKSDERLEIDLGYKICWESITSRYFT